MNLEEMKNAHKLLAKHKYQWAPLDKGYANRTLYVNISENIIKEKPVTQMMKEKFVGGRGFNLWLLWNATNKDTQWDSPENAICISGGPLCGTSAFPGSGKSICASISPLTNTVIDSNVGGHFGPLMKFSGFDALEIQGKAEEDVIIFINGVTHEITIEAAPLEPIDTHLVAEVFNEMYADNEEEKQNISVVSAGTAADHTRMGCLNFSWWDWRKQTARVKQAGRGGIGTVFRNKRIKALVVKTPNMRPKWSIAERWAEPMEVK